jgi:hydrogenase expression/formation protein HypC
MCLAVPLKLIEVEGEDGVVESGGVKMKINLSLVQGAKVGDYVIVHAGFAITLMDEKEAMESLKVLAEYEKAIS